jgi:hypothetical protein
MIVDRAFDDIASENYHYIGRRTGTLYPQGEGMRIVCIIAAQELITMGVWDFDSMRRLRSSLNEAIANTG